jgi:LPXTG-motif cell wall-anchored protein
MKRKLMIPILILAFLIIAAIVIFIIFSAKSLSFSKGRCFVAENGSYITFTLDGSETGIALYAQHGTPWQIYAAVGGGVAVLALAIFLIKKKKK